LRHKFFSEDVRKEKGVDEEDSRGGGRRQSIEKIVLPLCLSITVSLSLSAPLRKPLFMPQD
jgi:hypothetical protein